MTVRYRPSTVVRILLPLLIVAIALGGMRIAENALLRPDVDTRPGLMPLPPHQMQPHELALTGSGDGAPTVVASFNGEVFARRLVGVAEWRRLDVGDVVNGRSGTLVEFDGHDGQVLLLPTRDALVMVGPGTRIASSRELAGCVVFDAVVIDDGPALACREGNGWKVAPWGANGPGRVSAASASLTRVLDARSVGHADLDGDGSTDAVGFRARGELDLHVASDSRVRTIPFPALPAPKANGVVGIRAIGGDVNDDGVDDLVMYVQDLTGTSDVDGTWVVLGREDGALRAPVRIDGDRISSGRAPIVDDLDGDGRDEVVLVTAPAGDLHPRYRTAYVYSHTGEGWDRVGDYALPRGSVSIATTGMAAADGERGLVAAILGSNRVDGKLRMDAGLAVVPVHELLDERAAPPGPA